MLSVPGFVDLQVNGFLKVDFSADDLTEEKFIFAANELYARGTAAFLATVVTSSPETYQKNLAIIGNVIKRPEFSRRVLGIHVEGPFISAEPGAVGAHNPKYVRKPDLEFLRKMIEWSDNTIRFITIAAELDGAAEFVTAIERKRIVVSLGHQMALEEDLARLAKVGAKTITHLGNGMPNMIHRHKNTIWAALAEEKLGAMIITDGHHLPLSLIKTIIKVKGVNNVVVTSDAASLAGCPPGVYETLGNYAVLEESGLLHNPEKKCMVGSSAIMLQCINFLAKNLRNLSPEDLVQLGFYNPLKLIGASPELIKSDYRVEYDPGTTSFQIVK